MLQKNWSELQDVTQDYYICHLHYIQSLLPRTKLLRLNYAIGCFLRCMPGNLSPPQKVQLLYEVLVRSLTYAHDSEKNETRFCFVSAFLQGTAVCSGISELFYLLASGIGIETMIVCGTGGSGSDEGLHAWNMVKLNLDGTLRFYHLDVTWDLKTAPHEQSRFFLKGDDYMRGHEHDWLPGSYPVAPKDAPPMAPLPEPGVQRTIAVYHSIISSCFRRNDSYE